MSANEDVRISGAQCRAARALADLSRAMLADTSGISETVIRDFERKLVEPDDQARAKLRHALESFGALFIDDDKQGGRGVRLRFNAAEAARIDRLENEGGPTGEDDVA
jgi:ribosome-binding protein aMBF1 (putative translation factor)